MVAALAVAAPAHALAHAEFTASPQAGLIGTTFIFDASASRGVHFVWDLDGDGSYETDTGYSQQATKSYTGAGPVTVGLQVIDSDDSIDTYSLQITVLAPTEPPPPEDDVTPPVISNAFISPTAFRVSPKCSPHVTVKMHRTVAAGTRSLPFTGRIELRKLKPGGYRFVLDATDLSDNFSKTVYVPFIILPG